MDTYLSPSILRDLTLLQLCGGSAWSGGHVSGNLQSTPAKWLLCPAHLTTNWGPKPKDYSMLVMLVGSRLHREATPGALGISSNNGDRGFSRLLQFQ